MYSKIARWCVLWALCWMVSSTSPQAWAQDDVDFDENYRSGKVMISQGLYLDAVRLLYPVVYKTTKGKKHFGAHYYLGMAYYYTGSITQAVKALKKGRSLATKRSQRELLYILLNKITKSFGELQVVFEIDTKQVNLMKIGLKPQREFKDPIKRKSYYIIANLWKKKGISLKKNKTLWLPKGEYSLEIPKPLCLSYAFTIGGAVIRDLSISENPTTLGLKGKPSCTCQGGQVLKEEKGKRFCTCPKGRAWSSERKRCIIQKVVDNRGWFAKNWIWVTAVGVVVVGAAVAIPVGIVVAQSQDRNVEFGKTDLFLRR